MTSVSDSSVGLANQASRTTAILAVIRISYFMILLDNSIIFTAVPKIQGGDAPLSNWAGLDTGPPS